MNTKLTSSGCETSLSTLVARIACLETVSVLYIPTISVMVSLSIDMYVLLRSVPRLGSRFISLRSNDPSWMVIVEPLSLNEEEPSGNSIMLVSLTKLVSFRYSTGLLWRTIPDTSKLEV